MKKLVLFYLLIILIGLSCGKTKLSQVEQVPDCSLVLCVAQNLVLKVKFIDKVTQGNLVSGADALYTINDIKITSTQESNYEPIVRIDSADNQVIVIEYLRAGDFIKLGELPGDKLVINYGPRGKECCAKSVITSLSINNQRICGPCTDLEKQVIEIKK